MLGWKPGTKSVLKTVESSILMNEMVLAIQYQKCIAGDLYTSTPDFYLPSSFHTFLRGHLPLNAEHKGPCYTLGPLGD